MFLFTVSVGERHKLLQISKCPVFLSFFFKRFFWLRQIATFKISWVVSCCIFNFKTIQSFFLIDDKSYGFIAFSFNFLLDLVFSCFPDSDHVMLKSFIFCANLTIPLNICVCDLQWTYELLIEAVHLKHGYQHHRPRHRYGFKVQTRFLRVALLVAFLTVVIYTFLLIWLFRFFQCLQDERFSLTE